MILVETTRGTVEVPLTGAFTGAALTLRRLTTPAFRQCQARAMAVLGDAEALTTVLVRHDLIERTSDFKRAMSDPEFAAGFGAWLGAVECAIEAVRGWSGIMVRGESGAVPAPLARDRSRIAGIVEPVDPADLEARIVMETLLLDEHFQRQVSHQIDMAARILAIEGKGSGPLEPGTAGEAPTAEGLNGASAVSPPATGAPGG